MRKIIKAHDIWAVIVIPLLVLAMPYVLAWFWPYSGKARADIYDPRIWFTLFIFSVGIICRIKIFLMDYKIFFHKKWMEVPFDLLISIPVVFSGAITIFCFLPALFFARIVWLIKKQKHTKEEEKEKIIKNYLISIVLFLLWDKWDISLFWFVGSLVMFMTTTKVVVYFIVTYVAPIREDSLFLDKLIQGLLYMLCSAVLFSIGVAVTHHNKPSKMLRESIDSYYMNHEGFLDYFLWVLMAGFRPTKFIAGKNLLKYPIFADFVELVTVFTDRDGGNATKFFPWVIYQLLKFILWVCFFRRLRKFVFESMVFSKIWNLVAPKKGQNIHSLLEIKHANEECLVVAVSTDGREVLSANGELLKHKESAGNFLGHSIPVLIIGSMHYKPSGNKKKEPKARKWYFQRWLSPCRIHIHYLDEVIKGPTGDKTTFTKENDEKLREKKVMLGLLKN